MAVPLGLILEHRIVRNLAAIRLLLSQRRVLPSGHAFRGWVGEKSLSASFYVTQKPPTFRRNCGRAVEAYPGRNEAVPGGLRQLRYKMAREPPSRERTPSRSRDRHIRERNEALSEYFATFLRTSPHLMDLRFIQSSFDSNSACIASYLLGLRHGKEHCDVHGYIASFEGSMLRCVSICREARGVGFIRGNNATYEGTTPHIERQ